MASKNISITIDLYHELQFLKRQGESFSDVIWRLLHEQKKDPLAHFGILQTESPESQRTLEEGVQIHRKLLNKEKSLGL